MNSWLDPRTDDYIDSDPPVPEVDVADDAGAVGTILGPDGEPLRTVRRPFGFARR